MSFCFPACLRLRKRHEFQAVFNNKRRRVNGKYFTVLYSSLETKECRLGIIVSKKQAKRSVDRNRIKRIIRECFRHKADTLKPQDVLVIANAVSVDANNRELRQCLDGLIK